MAVQELFPAGTVTMDSGTRSVATSSGLTSGWQFTSASNNSNLDLDHLVTGDFDIATGVTLNSQMQFWVVPCQTDDLGATVTWPDVFDGVSASKTPTSTGVLQGCAKLAHVINFDIGTGTQTWFYEFPVAVLFGGVLPSRYTVYVTQNTGKTASFIAGIFYLRLQATVA